MPAIGGVRHAIGLNLVLAIVPGNEYCLDGKSRNQIIPAYHQLYFGKLL